MKISKIYESPDGTEYYGVFDRSRLLSMHPSKEAALSWRKTTPDPIVRDENAIEMTLAEKTELAKQIRD